MYRYTRTHSPRPTQVPSLSAHSVPVHAYALAASLAWPLVETLTYVARRVINMHFKPSFLEIRGMASSDGATTRLTTPRTTTTVATVVARSGVSVPGLTRCKAPIRWFPRLCRPTAAACSLRRRRYEHFTVHLCFFPQLFGGRRRRQKSRVYQFIMRRMRFFCAYGLVSSSCCGHRVGISPRGAG